MENATLTLLFTIIHYVCVAFDLLTPAYVMLLLSYYGIYEMSRSLHLVNVRYYERIKEDELTQPDSETDNDRSRDETVVDDEAEDDGEVQSDTDEVEENDAAEDGDAEDGDADGDEENSGDTTDSDMPPLLSFADTRPACNGTCDTADRLLRLLAKCAADKQSNCCSVQTDQATDIAPCDSSEQCAEQHVVSDDEHEGQEEHEEHEAPPAPEEKITRLTELVPENPPIKAARGGRGGRGGRGRGGSRGGRSVNLILQQPVDI
jgi:hypothetical protein